MTVKLRRYRGTSVLEVEISFARRDGTIFRRRLKSPFPSKTASKRWGEGREVFFREQLKREYERGPEEAPPEVPTLAEFAPVFIERHAKAKQLKPSGIDSKEGVLKNWLLPHLGSKRLDELDDSAFQELRHVMLTTPRKTGAIQPRRPKTVNNAMSVLFTILKVAKRWKVITRLPVTDVEWIRNQPPEISFYDFDAYEHLVKTARELDQRIYIAHLLCGDAGLRRGEMIAVELLDFDYSEKQPTLRVHKSEWNGITTPTRA